MSLIIFGTPENCINLDNFAEIALKIPKSRYFVNTENESDSLINPLSSDIKFVEVGIVLQKLWGGGASRTPSHSYSAKVCTRIGRVIS